MSAKPVVSGNRESESSPPLSRPGRPALPPGGEGAERASWACWVAETWTSILEDKKEPRGHTAV